MLRVQLTLGPQQFFDLERIRAIGPTKLNEIATVVAAAPKVIRQDELRKIISEQLPEQDAQVASLLRQILRLSNLRRERNLSPEQIIQILRQALDSVPEQVRWKEDSLKEWDSVEHPLQQLLSLETVTLVAKGTDLAYEYANLFQDARIVTDIRPVFDDDVNTVRGAIVSYTLRLSYDDQEGDHGISIAMDEFDVKNLLEECRRALKKGDTAKAFVERFDVPCAKAGEFADDTR